MPCASDVGDPILFDDFEAELLDHRIGEHFLGNTFHLVSSVLACEAIQLEHEKFALPHVVHFRKTEGRKSALDRLSLRIKDGWLGHHPNVSFHMRVIISGRRTI